MPSKKYVENLWEGPVDISSIHAAKGLEADYVVVLDMVQDFRGFPSTIEDDPVRRLVMPGKDLHTKSRSMCCKFGQPDAQCPRPSTLACAKSKFDDAANPDNPH